MATTRTLTRSCRHGHRRRSAQPSQHSQSHDHNQKQRQKQMQRYKHKHRHNGGWTPMMTMTMTIASILALQTVLVAAADVDGNKDHSYYPNGASNPNVGTKMYWKDSINVLEDLDKFDKLYVEYRNCAWSPLHTTQFDDDGDNSGDADGIIDNCGANYDEEDMWYLGKTACYRANVAYALYGILKGDNDSGCGKSTFINSFFTVGGVEAWIQSMQTKGYFPGYTTMSAFGDDDDDDGNGRRALAFTSGSFDQKVIGSYCNNDMPYYDDDFSNAGGAFDNDNGSNDGDDDGCNGCTLPTYDGVSSYGVGCAANGRFQMFEFNGKYCHADQVSKRLHKLPQFNRLINRQSCVAIYDSSLSSSNNNNYNNNGDSGDGDDNYLYNEQSSLKLLLKSRACTVELSTASVTSTKDRNMCPDPYNKVSSYSSSLNRSTNNVPTFLWVGTTRTRKGFIWSTVAMITIGTVLLVMTFDSRLRKSKKAWRWMLVKCGIAPAASKRSTATAHSMDVDTTQDEDDSNRKRGPRRDSAAESEDFPESDYTQHEDSDGGVFSKVKRKLFGRRRSSQA